jgi:prepilin-type processing-associated H-X9-DG protein
MQNLTWNNATGETREIKLNGFSGGTNYAHTDGHAKFAKWGQVWWRNLDQGIYAGNFDPRNQGRN